MKVQSVALAIAALGLWLIPSEAPAQGKSGKERLTICHIPPGNPDARSTMTLPEAAWPAHESHGDTLGPCDGYGVEESHGKKAGKKSNRKRDPAGSERKSGGYHDEEIEDSDRRSERRQRRAERRERESRSGSEGGSDQDEGDVVGEDDPDSEGDAIEDSERRAERRQRRAERESKTRTDTEVHDPVDAESDDTDPEEKGFGRRMRRFFGFGGDKSDE